MTEGKYPDVDKHTEWYRGPYDKNGYFKCKLCSKRHHKLSQFRIHYNNTHLNKLEVDGGIQNGIV